MNVTFEIQGFDSVCAVLGMWRRLRMGDIWSWGWWWRGCDVVTTEGSEPKETGVSLLPKQDETTHISHYILYMYLHIDQTGLHLDMFDSCTLSVILGWSWSSFCFDSFSDTHTHCSSLCKALHSLRNMLYEWLYCIPLIFLFLQLLFLLLLTRKWTEIDCIILLSCLCIDT